MDNWGELTGADPITDAGEPFGIGWGFIVNQEPRLLASVAEASESVIAVATTAAVPIAFSSSTSSIAAAATHPYKLARDRFCPSPRTRKPQKFLSTEKKREKKLCDPVMVNFNSSTDGIKMTKKPNLRGITIFFFLVD